MELKYSMRLKHSIEEEKESVKGEKHFVFIFYLYPILSTVNKGLQRSLTQP